MLLFSSPCSLLALPSPPSQADPRESWRQMPPRPSLLGLAPLVSELPVFPLPSRGPSLFSKQLLPNLCPHTPPAPLLPPERKNPLCLTFWKSLGEGRGSPLCPPHLSPSFLVWMNHLRQAHSLGPFESQSHPVLLDCSALGPGSHPTLPHPHQAF